MTTKNGVGIGDDVPCWYWPGECLWRDEVFSDCSGLRREWQMGKCTEVGGRN